MAGKSQPERIRVIDKYLSTGRKFTWEQLRDRILEEGYFIDKGIEDVLRKTILDNIKVMRNGYNIYEPAPIPKGQDGNFYSKDFSLFKHPRMQSIYIHIHSMMLLKFP